jgi:hypothetical protein
MYEIQQPARADDRQIRIGTAGNVGLQLLLQGVPVHHFDLDGVAWIRLLEFGSHLLEVGLRLIAVVGHGDTDVVRVGLDSGKANRG